MLSQSSNNVCVLHIAGKCCNERVWIQLDNTEDGIAEELIAAGISQQHIVLGFHEPEILPYTGFAVA